ncbi:MAG: hypothetical protein FIA94_10395 [Nitrospirae bacterium]|nr:hypothetical protein [Nitrospirota bacterium]
MNGNRVSVLKGHAAGAMLLIFSVVSAFLLCEVSAEASGKDDCVAHYQKKAKCQAATYIIAETCKCKYDSNCRYPNSKAIECILDNIRDAQDNSAAYLMRNSCIQKNLLTGK